MRGAEGGREREGVVRGEDVVLPPHRQGLSPVRGLQERGREGGRERERGREGGRERQPTAAAVAYGWTKNSGERSVPLVDGGFVHGES